MSEDVGVYKLSIRLVCRRACEHHDPVLEPMAMVEYFVLPAASATQHPTSGRVAVCMTFAAYGQSASKVQKFGQDTPQRPFQSST